MVLHGKAAACPPRQFVHARALPLLGVQPVAVDHHRCLRVADGEAADLFRRVEVAFHDRRRHKQQIGEVVEPARRVVRRQQQRVVDLFWQCLDCQQIADRVLVFRCGSADARAEACPGFGAVERVAIDRCFQVSRRARRTPPWAGRGAPAGGIAPVRSLRMTFSQVSACADGFVRSAEASVSPPGLETVVVTRHAVFLDSRAAAVASGFSRTSAACAASAQATSSHGIRRLYYTLLCAFM